MSYRHFSTRRSSSAAQSKESPNDNMSSEEQPEDLEEARIVIERLTRQLKIHDDVPSKLIALQHRIQHAHQRNQEAMQKLEDRLEKIKMKWTRELEEQHKRWLDQCNQLVKQVENAYSEIKIASMTSTKGTDCNATNATANKSTSEVKEITIGANDFDEMLRLKQQIRSIDERLKALAKKEQSLNVELAKQLNTHFHKPIIKITEEQSDENFYGVFELFDINQKTIENLDQTLRALEHIRKVPKMISIDEIEQSMPSMEEIDEIIIVMRRFLAKLRVQLTTARGSNKSNINPLMYDGQDGSLMESSGRAQSDFPGAVSERAESNFQGAVSGKAESNFSGAVSDRAGSNFSGVVSDRAGSNFPEAASGKAEPNFPGAASNAASTGHSSSSDYGTTSLNTSSVPQSGSPSQQSQISAPK